MINDDTDLHALVDRLERVVVDSSECFLCAKPLIDGDYTNEHVVPSWVQRRYKLENQRLSLLNDTTIPYRQLTVPCCGECNRVHLRAVEDSVAQTAEQGHKAVSALDPKVLFLWLGKIFFGILYKEVSLLIDRADPSSHTIIDRTFLQLFQQHRLFLQLARDKIRLIDAVPGSIFIWPVQPLKDPEDEWDLMDEVGSAFIGCRVGKVALFAALADGGALKHIEAAFSTIQDMPLHPLQFRELGAFLAYKVMLATRTPKYITIESTPLPHQVFQLPLYGLSSKPLFEKGDAETYARVLSKYTMIPIEHLYRPPDSVRSWLWTPNGKPNFMSVQEYPPEEWARAT